MNGEFGGQSVESGDSDTGRRGGFIQGQGGTGPDGDYNAIGHLAHHGAVFIGSSTGCCRPQNKCDQDGKQNLPHCQVPLL